jgi:hypothetical protein
VGFCCARDARLILSSFSAGDKIVQALRASCRYSDFTGVDCVIWNGSTSSIAYFRSVRHPARISDSR